MKKYLSFIVIVCAVLTQLTGCGSGTGNVVDALPYSPFVEGFTSGRVSRVSPIYLVLSQEVPAEKMTAADLKKTMKIKPEVEGEFTFEDARTVVFKPSVELERNKSYSVTADLSQWFDVEKKDKDFTFKFTTMPMALRASFDALDINADNDANYDVRFTLLTPDSEGAETVEGLVEFTEGAAAVWQHSPDGRKHQLTASSVEPGRKGVRNFGVKVKSNKFGVPAEEIASAYIPGKDDFGVYDITYVTSPEKYIEVTFTQALDNTQNMNGLAYVEGNKSKIVNTDGNKLRLYPDAGRKGTLTVGLSSRIRSKSGATMPESISRTVEINAEKPQVRFVGDGEIIPQSPQLLIPFQAVYLRGVVVKVIKIAEGNVGQFLQINNFDGTSELMRVGRLVMRKTIFLDEEDGDLTSWGTYAIDLKKLIEPEQGAIYRVELSFTRDLSLYPCDNGDEYTPMTREQILAEDEELFKKEAERYDEGGYYYYDDDDYYWYYYDYDERRDPCSEGYYYNKKESRNVLATNLGLIAKMGEDREMLVMVHNLLSTSPEKGVEVALYNYQHQELGKGTTDEKGHARVRFESGKPYYIVASQGKQRSYMRVDAGTSLSYSSFDVDGSVVQKGIKGFIYGDRGVWRPGDTMYLGFMLNDRTQKLPADHPVIMELYSPAGQMVQRKTQTKGALGVYAFEMKTEPDAPTGSWNAVVKVGGVQFGKRVRVETIKPNRLKIDLKLPKKVLQNDEPLNATMHVEWMQGAKARNLKYEIDATFSPMPTKFDNYKDYVFEDYSKVFNTGDSHMIQGTTDEYGDAVVKSSFSVGKKAPGMLNANFSMRVYEESGDFSIDAVNVPFSPYKKYVGIKSPNKGREHLNTGENHKFEIVSVTPDGKSAGNLDLLVQVYKVSWYWWYNMDNNRIANYISDSYNKPVDNKYLTTDGSGRVSFTLNFSDDDWGTYYIVARDKWGGHSAGILSYFDWPYLDGRRSQNDSDAADKLSFKTDKDTYAPGDKMTITIPSSGGSRAVVSIENGTRVLSVTEHECDAKETRIKLDVTPEMQPNAYINVTLLQPHGMTQNDLPIRLYGVVPITVTSPQSRVTPVIKADDEIRPESKYEIVVSEKDGREMAYTLAIVDEGLLDLTRFKTPDPWGTFNAREALGVSSWDMYKWVVGAYGGRIDQMFSIGGDNELANSGPKAIVNRFKPVVKFEGPFVLKKGSRQKHTYEMPNYTGRVRVMVVASTGEAYGNAEKTIMVRKPLMVLGTLPRVIGVGEEMVVPATVFTTRNNMGNVKVSIQCSDNMEIVGASSQDLMFSEASDQMAKFRIRVKGKAGAGKVTLTATSKDDKSVYETDIEIRAVRREQVVTQAITLEPGKSFKETVAMPGADGTNRLTLEVSDVQPLDLSSRLSYLLGYPHGCIEQITSKGFPQLYVSKFASLTKEQQTLATEAVKDVIRRQKSYQTSDGGMAYWPSGTYADGWGSVYAAHFQIEAEAKGYLVPEGMKRSLVNHLKLVARNWKSTSTNYGRSEAMTQAYRLYVLALANQAELGAMNRLKELNNVDEMTRWTLAAAYALSGRKDVAKELTEKTSPVKYAYDEYDMTYGSSLRDLSIRLITMTLLDDGANAAVAANEISRQLADGSWYSTQTTAFALVGMSQYLSKFKAADSMEFNYSCGGKSDKVKTDKSVWSELMLENGAASAPVEITNKGKGTLFVRIIKAGIPDQGMEEAYARGLQVEVTYRGADGKPIDVSQLKQGTNFSAEVVVKNPTLKQMKNVVLSQIFPAGWEILNTRFMQEGAVDKYPAGVDYQDIRDDRVYTYMDKLASGRQVTVSVNLAAVYSGRYYLPPVFCELMYDNTTRANTEGREITVE